jgi:intracellular sulfur oxidation DsrE/DsrF family protein
MYACGLSLKKFGVDPASLPKLYHVVPNGLVFGFELQKEGYYSITL